MKETKTDGIETRVFSGRNVGGPLALNPVGLLRELVELLCIHVDIDGPQAHEQPEKTIARLRDAIISAKHVDQTTRDRLRVFLSIDRES